MDYWRIGQAMASGDWLLVEEGSVFRPPLYPAYLALCQTLFGDWALVGAVVGQHLMGLATALLIGKSCQKLTGSNLAFLVAYGVSMLCLGRLQWANWIMTESLFTLLLTTHLLALVWWSRNPSQRSALWLGLTLGMTMLVRAVTQYLWLPELALIAFAWRRESGARLTGAFKQTIAFVLALAIVVMPWLARNYVLHDQFFLTKAIGRNLWIACFEPVGAELDLPDRDEIQEVFEEPRRSWAVYSTLRKRGMSEIESDDWMRQVAVSAILTSPRQYALFVARNAFAFWWTVDGAHPWYFRHDQNGVYMGQRVWESRALIGPFDNLLRFLYRYSQLLSAVFSFLSLAGAVVLALSADHRKAGIGLLLVLCYLAATTATAEPALFRYRSVAEPLMIVSLVSGTWLMVQRTRWGRES